MNTALEPKAVPLSKKVVSAGAWSLGLRSGLRFVGFVRNVILARLLAPEDFGLFGITLVVLSILERFTNTGLQAALVQKDQDVRDYLNTAWTIQMARGIGLGLGLVLGASTIATFFEEPAVAPLVKVLGVTVLLRGFLNPGIVHFRRELEYKPQFTMRLGSTIVDLAVSITLAFVLRSVWALMFGMLAGNIASLILSYSLHPYRPRVRINWGRAKELGRFGRWVFLNNALFFLAYRGDNFVIGKILGAPALGVYMLAYTISEVVTVEISRVVTEIGFPAFSRIQGRRDQLRRWYLAAIELVMSIAAPFTIALFLLAEPITNVVLGSKWLEVATVLPALAVAGCARSLAKNGSAVFNAVGLPSLSFRMNLIGVVITYGIMVFLIGPYGLLGVAMAVAAGQLGTLVPFLHYSRKSIGIRVTDVVRNIVPGLALTVVVGVLVGVVESVGISELAGLILALGAALIGYVAVAVLLWRTASVGPLRLTARFLPGSRTGDVDSGSTQGDSATASAIVEIHP